MAEKLAWGIMGTGSIAHTFAKGVQHSKLGTLVAVGSRDQASADKFGAEFGLTHCHGSYEALLADPAVQAVYISVPHPMHAEWAIKTAEAGKAILCEKPLAMNHADAMAVVNAAEENQVFLMEAFMYRCHPQIEKLVQLIRDKAIGDVRLIQATFSFQAGLDLKSRIFSNAMGGGGILDVGCYTTSIARLIAGAASGLAVAEPTSVSGVANLNAVTGTDDVAIATLKFPGDILAQISTGVLLNQENVIRVFGSEGKIVLCNPYIPSKEGGVVEIELHKNGQDTPMKIQLETSEWLYGAEADVVAKYLGAKQAPFPYVNWQDSLGNMKTLDQWRESVGLTYDLEKPEASLLTVAKRPLARRAKHAMKYGKIAGLTKPISRLVLGCDNQFRMPHASVMFDDFYERGGNCFDTAYIYAGGTCEKLLGHWMKNRKVRDSVVVIGKGAHTPWCDPASIERQLFESLERLQTSHVDIYLMHRDNLDIPAGDFVEALNRHQKAGRIGVFGGSNWSLSRIREANAYAKAKGLNGFSAVSNNFSLARMVDPVWGGCIAASDTESRAWLAKEQFPLLAWSSQARGFFTERADPKNLSDEELVRCWYSPDNFQRRDRVLEMAKKRGVLPIQVALAYVLAQPFPTFPLIGPRVLSETRSSMGALDVDLSPEDLRWLNLEA
ncbi:MAG: aldo/keto reductase [candidate division FCPU426 bacterium]